LIPGILWAFKINR